MFRGQLTVIYRILSNLAKICFNSSLLVSRERRMCLSNAKQIDGVEGREARWTKLELFETAFLVTARKHQKRMPPLLGQCLPRHSVSYIDVIKDTAGRKLVTIKPSSFTISTKLQFDRFGMFSSTEWFFGTISRHNHGAMPIRFITKKDGVFNKGSWRQSQF